MNFSIRHKPIAWLVAAHLVVGILLSWQAHHELGFGYRVIGLITFVIAQAGLLGCWGGLSNIYASQRALGMFLAHFLLVLEFHQAADVDVAVYGLLVAIIVGCCLGALALRRWYGPLRHCDNTFAQRNRRQFQFSIRQLFLLTFVVSLALAFHQLAGKVDDALPANREWGELTLLVLLFVLTTTVSTWAALAIGSPALRIVGALATAGYAAYVYGGFMRQEFELSLLLFGGHTLVVFGSLLVARLAGFRLITQDLLAEYDTPDTTATR